MQVKIHAYDPYTDRNWSERKLTPTGKMRDRRSSRIPVADNPNLNLSKVSENCRKVWFMSPIRVIFSFTFSSHFYVLLTRNAIFKKIKNTSDVIKCWISREVRQFPVLKVENQRNGCQSQCKCNAIFQPS